MLRRATAAVRALAAALLLAGCGSGSSDPVQGPSLERVLSTNAESAARNTLARYVQQQSDRADADLSAAMAAWQAEHPSPAPDSPPPPPPAGLARAHTKVAQWKALRQLLGSPGGMEQVARLKEHKIQASGDSGATSRLVLTIEERHQPLLGREMTFDLDWARSVRQVYDPVTRKTAQKGTWEVRSSVLVETSKEPGGQVEKE